MVSEFKKGHKMAKHNRFARGTGVYTCTVCGGRTRETDPDAANHRQCAECWTLAGIENDISDGHHMLAEVQDETDSLRARIVARGGTDWWATEVIGQV